MSNAENFSSVCLVVLRENWLTDRHGDNIKRLFSDEKSAKTDFDDTNKLIRKFYKEKY